VPVSSHGTGLAANGDFSFREVQVREYQDHEVGHLVMFLKRAFMIKIEYAPAIRQAFSENQ
jgi:hypothetical protein